MYKEKHKKRVTSQRSSRRESRIFSTEEDEVNNTVYEQFNTHLKQQHFHKTLSVIKDLTAKSEVTVINNLIIR
jgi:hypothetical protein